MNERKYLHAMKWIDKPVFQDDIDTPSLLNLSCQLQYIEMIFPTTFSQRKKPISIPMASYNLSSQDIGSICWCLRSVAIKDICLYYLKSFVVDRLLVHIVTYKEEKGLKQTSKNQLSVELLVSSLIFSVFRIRIFSTNK